MASSIPLPAVARLCTLYQVLCDLNESGQQRVSSSALGEILGVGAHNVRKDISYLGETASAGGGYNVINLIELIALRMGFNREKVTCVVGLGHLGSAILHHERFRGGEFKIVAGFDSNINLIETMHSGVNLFPAYEITETVKKMHIELAILTVPSSGAQEVAQRLIDGGIEGIINFTPVVIKAPSSVLVRNVDLTGEFRVLSALLHLRENN
ncbi:redox-sensing transcriptional repressor Rex [Chitinispirillales bacterium ANBcel5]|uniref:redox-sensing transcriptional repressor Rex n=1 Tax=Cellulosispirillum alkaliphilum TaxID=3039283 RepID=UPI002A582901|nr:redox-sensing transcriptional repressor Rex [Chitinispirillales bacterium ANBcel5]